MRHIRFVLLNILFIGITIGIFSAFSGENKNNADQSSDYFTQFYGPEVQRTADGAFIRNMRWSAQDGTLYLIRQPNDDGFNIMAVAATTVNENQQVAIEIDTQQVAQYRVVADTFRNYKSLVRLEWQPFAVFNTVRLKNTETTVVDGRVISLAISNVEFMPIATPKSPSNVMVFYLVMVVLLGTWVYCQFSPKIVVGVYGVFGLILAGIWWWGVKNLVMFGLTHMPVVWLVVGLIANGIIIYQLYRAMPTLQHLIHTEKNKLATRFASMREPLLPAIRCGLWLWQRPVVLYTVTVMLYFSPWLWQQQIIYPINLRLAANLPVTAADYNTSSYFSDYVYYVSEAHMLMHTPRAGWLGEWSDMTQLGRPLSQLSGWNVSYVLTWVLRIWINNPFVFFTVNFVLYAYLAGVFALLYVRRLLQHTGLALLAAYLISASPFFFYWNTYLTFIATTCWSLALLYSLVRLQARPDWSSALLLTFVVYSLLSMGYQQIVIHIVYMMIGYFGYLLWQLRMNRPQLVRFALYAVIAVLTGTSMVIPVYLDTMQIAILATVRQTVSADYFYEIMPYFHTMTDLFRVELAYLLKDIFTPILDYKTLIYPYRGGHTTLFVFILMMIGAIWRWRDTWGWSVWVVIAVIFSFSRDAFIFGYAQLHLPQLSRAVMFFGAGHQIPEMILAVYGLQVLISDTFARTTKILLGVVGLSVALIISATMMTFTRDTNFQWVFMGEALFVQFELVVVGCVFIMALVDSPRFKMAMVFAILSLQVVVLLQPMVLMQSTKAIIETSPSADVIRQTLQPGERLALVDELDRELSNARTTYNELTPFGLNYNAVLRLPQVGGYYPLQSKYYVALMKRFGVNYDYYNPYMRKINLPMPENDQWLANIRTIVSKKPLTDSTLTLTARTDGFIPFYVYTTPSTMGCCLQVPLSDVRIDATAQAVAYWIDTPKAATNRQLQKSENQGDRFVVPVAESTKESIIVFSQIFHPQWYARVRTADGWYDAPTVVVNEAYQGVRVPVGTQEVVMEFRSWAYWSIIPNLFWVIAGLVVSVHSWMNWPFIQPYRMRLRWRFFGKADHE